MNHSLDHAFVAPFTGSEPCSPAPLGGVVVSCRQPITSPGGVFNMSHSSQHQELINTVQSHSTDPEPLTTTPSKATAGSNESARAASRQSLTSKQNTSPRSSGDASHSPDENTSSQPSSDGVRVAASDDKAESSSSPAKAGDDPDTSAGDAPGTTDGAGAPPRPSSGSQTQAQADRIQAHLTSEREFDFKEEFPEAEFNPNPNCKVDHLFKSSLDLQLNHFGCYDGPTQFLLRTVYKKTKLRLRDGERGYWNNKGQWEGYDARGCLIATSGYEQRIAFCLCGVPRRDRKRSGCQDITFCPRCNFHRRLKPMRKEFGHCFKAAPAIYFITLSIMKGSSLGPRLKFEDTPSMPSPTQRW